MLEPVRRQEGDFYKVTKMRTLVFICAAEESVLGRGDGHLQISSLPPQSLLRSHHSTASWPIATMLLMSRGVSIVELKFVFYSTELVLALCYFEVKIDLLDKREGSHLTFSLFYSDNVIQPGMLEYYNCSFRRSVNLKLKTQNHYSPGYSYGFYLGNRAYNASCCGITTMSRKGHQHPG